MHFAEEHDGSELIVPKAEKKIVKDEVEDEEEILYEVLPVQEALDTKVSAPEIQKYFDKLPKCMTIKRK